MKVEIDPKIQADGALLNYAQHATEILQHEVRTSRLWDQTSATWTLLRTDDDLSLQLQISDGLVQVSGGFSWSELRDRDHIIGRMIHLWGDLLQARSHALLRGLSASETSSHHLDGDEALDRILDSLAEYSEREGHEPKSIKLPFRYATALMKLGPSYWGEFYRQIRESGLGAFDGQTLLGMKVELVPGVDAELQVA